MSNVSNFNTDVGVPVSLDGGKEAFRIYPNDMDFLEKVSQLYKESKIYVEKATKKRQEMVVKNDDFGVSENVDEYIKCMKDDFNFNLKQIDNLLGEGVSEKVFKGRMDEDLFSRFMDFLSAEIEKNRNSNINKYKKNREQRRHEKKVMD